MKVTIKQKIEDSNVFTGDEAEAARQPAPYAKSVVVRSENPLIVQRVDALHKGATYDLPESQAQNLIDLGYAEETDA